MTTQQQNTQIKQVDSLADLDDLANKVNSGNEKTAEEIAAEDAEKKRLEDEEAAKKAEEEKNKSKDDDKSDFKDEDLEPLIEKAKEKGIDTLTEEEKKFLLDKGVLEEEQEQGNNDDNTKVKEAIEKLTGVELDIELDKVSLGTPEGIVQYMKKYTEQEMYNFEQELAKKYPTAYKAMLIEADGGDVVEYLKGNKDYSKDYTNLTLEEDNPNQYKEIIKASLKLKGIDEDSINDFIKIAEDGNKLKDKASTELNYIKKVQTEEREEVLKRNELKQKQDYALMSDMANTITKLTETGTIGEFILPDKEKKGFNAYLLDNVQYKDGKFFITKEIGKDNLIDTLKSEYFSYKKGDIAALVKREAEKKLVLKLEENAKNKKLAFKNGKGSDTGFTALGDL